VIDLHSARQDAIYVRNAGFGTAARIIEELADEVKRLTDAVAEERAAIVAWLRRSDELEWCADTIERGEHRREEER
jgi:hypothetical protein